MSASIIAAPRDVDPTFARDGKLRFGFGAGFSDGHDAVIQPNDREH